MPNRRERRQMRQDRLYGDRRHPKRYNATELRTLIVEDACSGWGPASQPDGFGNGMAYLEWVTLAFQRIAAVERKKLDDVFIECEAEVMQRTGHGMPL